MMDSAILDSNFYQEASKLYAQTGLFGTGCMLIEEDEDDDVVCETLPVGSFWLGTDHRRRVNQFAREMDMTIRQMADAFGAENLQERHRSSLENGTASKERIKVLHMIYPNDGYNQGMTLTSHRYVSVYIDPTDNDKNSYLRMGGYDEFPIIAPRWKSMGDDVYGLECPGMIALGNIKQLQHAHKQMAKAIEKQVSPPTMRPEGTLRKGVDTTPGADNVVANRGAASDGIKPIYQVNFDIGGVTQMIDNLRSQIRETFFYNLFLMVANERRSGTKAREIDELHEEKMIILSTVYEQFSHEFLDPAIERIFSILNRRGRLPVPPPELQGQEIKVEYVSVMAQAMKLVGIGNMDRALAILGQTASIDPSVLDIMDLNKFAKSYIDRLGVDARVMASDQEIADKQAARNAQAEKAQIQQMASVEAETAKNLSAAKLDEDNALTQMLGNTIG
jgi:hypothetical protein